MVEEEESEVEAGGNENKEAIRDTVLEGNRCTDLFVCCQFTVTLHFWRSRQDTVNNVGSVRHKARR